MPSKSKVTTDHEEIRRWAEERGGKPARVKQTGGGDDPGVLRIEFPGYGRDEALEPISWDEFFEKFDENGLASLYQDRKADGELSTFKKLVSRETVQAGAGRGRSRGSARTQARSSRTARGSRTTSARSARRSSSGSARRSKSSAQSRRSSSQSRSSRSTSGGRSGSSRRTSAQSKSARGVSSKKASRGSRGNRGRRAA